MSEMEIVNPHAALAAKMDDDSLSHAALDVGNRIDAKKADFECFLASDVDRHAAIIAELAHRMFERKATLIFAPSAEVEMKITTRIDHRIDVLRGLEGLVPDEDYHAAIYEKTTVEYKANAVKLNTMARKYGGKVKDIVDAGLPKVQVGLPKIIVRPRAEIKTVEEIAA